MIARSSMKYVSEKIVAALLQPDPSISHKFFETYCQRSPPQAEKKLMLAVLEDAILCLRGKGLGRVPNKENISLEAEKWVLGQDSDGVFSFQNICEVLGLNPASVRQQLLRGQRRTYLCG